MPPRAQQAADPPPRSQEWRKFKGLNRTDARVGIDDDEFAALENAMTIGNGAVQIVPYTGVPIATPAGGVRSIWGFTLNGAAIQMVVGLDGRLSQVATPAGTIVTAAAPGSLSQNPHLTIWRASHILIGDPTHGYSSWDGTTHLHYPLAFTGNTHTSTLIDNIAPSTVGLVQGMGIGGAGIPAGATIVLVNSASSVTISAATTSSLVGTAVTVGAGALTSITALAVFEGRAWLSKGRTIQVTSPGSFADFSPSSGATSFIITDEAFAGDVVAMVSVIEQLWVLGESSIEAVANVQTISSPIVLTTFSITNIVADLGTSAAQTARGYFRALTFLTAFGFYALAGVTPQKLSDKLDGLFEDLDLGPDVTAAVAIVNSLPVLTYLVTLRDPQTGPRPILLCFTQGKCFTASQGALRWTTSVQVGGVTQAWGTDGTRIYQLFGAALDTPTPYEISSKLFALGSAVTVKDTLKCGFEFQAPHAIDPQVYIDSESGSVRADIRARNIITGITNDAGEVMTLVNDLGEVLYIVTSGMILAKTDVAQTGQYLGFTIKGNDPPYRLQAFELEYVPTREWNY